jgi:hypothetical protein
MSFSSGIDGVRQTSDVTLPDDRVNMNMETLSRGEMTSKRLQASEERGGDMRKVMATAKVNHVPHVLNTNNFISTTRPNPSLNRLCSFYPFTLPRLYERAGGGEQN